MRLSAGLHRGWFRPDKGSLLRQLLKMYLKSSGRSLRRVRKDRRKTIFAGLRGARLRPARFLTKPRLRSVISFRLAVHSFLAWGLSALCSLFPPGEAELLPAPSPSAPTRIPLRITLPYPAPSIPLSLLLNATDWHPACTTIGFAVIKAAYTKI